MKIVINKCFGGFALSETRMSQYAIRKGVTALPDDDDFPIQIWDIPRDDPDLVYVVQQIPEDEGICGTDLHVIEIPDDVDWQIEDWDGCEHIVDKKRIWR
jgi:hypothetical protein